MHCYKMPCVVLLAMLVFAAGCAKQDKPGAMKKSAEMPAIGKKSAVDTSDIFKEFYSEDTAGQGKTKKSSKSASAKSQTFSPSSAATASAGEFAENGRYVVQVACVPTKALAEKMAATLKDKNFPAYTAAVQNPTPKLSGTYYRVRIGSFKGLMAAKTFGEQSLVALGYQYWVDKKSNDNVGMEGYGLGGAAPASNPSSSYESAPPSPSSWSSIPPSSPAPTPAAPAETKTAAPVPAPASSAPSAPAASAAAAEPVKASPAASVAPAPAPAPAPAATPAPASATKEPTKASPPATGKGASGSNEWGADSSSSAGGW